ncbi:MAG: MFS family permease [Verrucomicrobiales bacterium]|jgi:MFS family permease
MQNSPEITTEAVAETIATAGEQSGGDSLFFMIFVALIMLFALLSAFSAVLGFMFTMTLFRVPEEHRAKLSLGSVWGIMIPVFGVYWMWVVTGRLADAFQAYFDDQDPEDVEIPDSDFGRRFGTYACGAAAIGHLAMLLALTRNLWVLGIALGICLLAGLVCVTIYFWQVFSIRRRIPDPESEIPEDYL